MAGKPSAPALPVDPNLATEQQQAQNDLVTSLQSQTQGDMSNLMARYGMQLAMAGTNYGPMNAPGVSSTTGGLTTKAA